VGDGAASAFWRFNARPVVAFLLKADRRRQQAKHRAAQALVAFVPASVDGAAARCPWLRWAAFACALRCLRLPYLPPASSCLCHACLALSTGLLA